jgi:CubicO group peptidase (beta-lactamase class C family)
MEAIPSIMAKQNFKITPSMKRLLPLLITILIANFTFAQTKNYQAVTANFQKNYNANEYEEIFNHFSPKMKEALPMEETKVFLTNLKREVGKMDSMEFIKYHEKTYARYKTRFEKAIMALNISLDDQNQINGFFLKPYEEPQLGENTTVNSLSSYPKEVAELLFSATKNLPNNAQLSVAVIQNGETKYYGIIKFNDTIKPAENQKRYFEIGSITKVFTSTILADLVESKKIKLTDEINSFYPFAFNDNLKITFESLANHTSGLPRLPNNLDSPDDMNPYKSYGKTEIESYLKKLVKLENKPSVAYSYSNLGAGLLGYTLGLSQKTSFQNLLQKKVFDKYKMTSSVTSSQNLGNSLIKGLNNKGETVSNWDFDILFGAGGIISTTSDLAKFAVAQFNPQNKELELTRKTTFEIKGDTKIGLGWHKLESKNGEDLIWHSGGTGGYSSSMIMKIEEKSAVIILSNVSNINENIDTLSLDLLTKTTKK